MAAHQAESRLERTKHQLEIQKILSCPVLSCVSHLSIHMSLLLLFPLLVFLERLELLCVQLFLQRDLERTGEHFSPGFISKGRNGSHAKRGYLLRRPPPALGDLRVPPDRLLLD